MDLPTFDERVARVELTAMMHSSGRPEAAEENMTPRERADRFPQHTLVIEGVGPFFFFFIIIIFFFFPCLFSCSRARQRWKQSQSNLAEHDRTGATSGAEASVAPPAQSIRVTLEKTRGRSLGITLRGGPELGGLWIDSIEDGSAADFDPDLALGSRLLSVAGRDVSGLSIAGE